MGEKVEPRRVEREAAPVVHCCGSEGVRQAEVLAVTEASSQMKDLMGLEHVACLPPEGVGHRLTVCASRSCRSKPDKEARLPTISEDRGAERPAESRLQTPEAVPKKQG